MSEFEIMRLGELLKFQNGRTSPERFEQGKFSVYGSNGVIGRSDITNAIGPSVVIGRVGSYCGSVYFAKEDCWVTDNAIQARGLESMDSRYLYYLALHTGLNNWRTGSGQPLLNQATLSAIPVQATKDESEQRAIAGVLGAIDDKIETNRRLIETLDELYMAECESVLSVSSENVSLGEVASLSLGGTPSKVISSFWEGGDIPWINSGRLHEFPVLTPSDFITAEGLSKSATKLIPKGSTVVAITGATLGVASRLAIDTTINQSIVAVECPGNVALNGFMLYALRANMAELVSSATGAAQQHVNKANFEELVISIPASKDRGLLRDIPSLIGQIDVLAHENVTLSILRNTLLPELLSGRLRVKDAESMMENV